MNEIDISINLFFLSGGVSNVHERPAGDGFPAVIRIIDDDEEDLRVNISSGEEREGEYEVSMVRDGQRISPLLFDEEGDDSRNKFVTDYDGDNDGDGSRPASSLVRPFPPDGFWQGFRPTLPSFASSLTSTGTDTAAPQQPTVRVPLELPGLQVEPHAKPAVFQRWDDCAPSTSGLSTSAKRRREDSDPGEVSSKRQRLNCEEVPKQMAPSTSLLRSGKRSRKEHYTEEVSAKRQRWNSEEPPEESVPSTSGLGSFEEPPEESVPSTSGLRSFEEPPEEWVSSTSGLRSFEEPPEVWVSSTSGLRSFEEPPEEWVSSTSGLRSFEEEPALGRNQEETSSSSFSSSSSSDEGAAAAAPITEGEAEEMEAIRQSENVICGICMNNVYQKTDPDERVFGILPNCNHSFCLECIRTWRKTKGFEKTVVKGCPHCRVKSGFCVPNKYWVEGQAKESVIAEFKEKLSKKRKARHDRLNPEERVPFHRYLEEDPRGSEVVSFHRYFEEDPHVSEGVSEELVSSTSGLGSFEETTEESVSSTSGLEESPEESILFSSDPGSSTSESLGESYLDSAPSNSFGFWYSPGRIFWVRVDDSDSDTDSN